MKAIKISAIILAMAAMLSLTACTKYEKENINDTSMFVVIEETSSWVVVYHKETKVMYAVSWGGYNAGTFTVMVDENGKPLIYNEESEV